MAVGPYYQSLLIVSACVLLVSTSAQNDIFRVRFNLENLESGAPGYFIVEVRPDWAPLGAERFAELVENHFFDDTRFFKVTTGFIAEFGISGDPAVTAAWSGKTLQDDRRHEDVDNHRGSISFVTEGKGDRSTRISINVKDNDHLDRQGYVPFAEVIEGMFNVDRLYNRYGGSAKFPDTPDPSRIASEGNVYLDKQFPKLTKIKSVEIIKTASAERPGSSHGRALLFAAGACLVSGIVGGGWWLTAGSSTKGFAF